MEQPDRIEVTLASIEAALRSRYPDAILERFPKIDSSTRYALHFPQGPVGIAITDSLLASITIHGGYWSEQNAAEYFEANGYFASLDDRNDIFVIM